MYFVALSIAFQLALRLLSPRESATAGFCLYGLLKYLCLYLGIGTVQILPDCAELEIILLSLCYVQIRIVGVCGCG